MGTSTASKVSEVLGAQGLHTIGALVFWTLSGVRIPRATLKEALEALGLGAAMVRQPSPTAVLALAVKRVGMGRKGWLFRQMKKEWAAVQERGEGKTLKHSHVATFRMNAQDEVECEMLEACDELPALLLALQGAHHQITQFAHSSDMSEVLCAALQGVGSNPMLGGLSLRQSTGGLYYVSAAKVDAMKALAAMVNDKAPQSAVEVMTLTGDGENLEAAARNVRGNITTQLRETRAEIVEFVKALKENGKSARSHSVVVRAEQFKQMRDRVAMFADVLGDTVGGLQAQIETARVELMTELERA